MTGSTDGRKRTASDDLAQENRGRLAQSKHTQGKAREGGAEEIGGVTFDQISTATGKYGIPRNEVVGGPKGITYVASKTPSWGGEK